MPFATSSLVSGLRNRFALLSLVVVVVLGMAVLYGFAQNVALSEHIETLKRSNSLRQKHIEKADQENKLVQDRDIERMQLQRDHQDIIDVEVSLNTIQQSSQIDCESVPNEASLSAEVRREIQYNLMGSEEVYEIKRCPYIQYRRTGQKPMRLLSVYVRSVATERLLLFNEDPDWAKRLIFAQDDGMMIGFRCESAGISSLASDGWNGHNTSYFMRCEKTFPASDTVTQYWNAHVNPDSIAKFLYIYQDGDIQRQGIVRCVPDLGYCWDTETLWQLSLLGWFRYASAR